MFEKHVLVHWFNWMGSLSLNEVDCGCGLVCLVYWFCSLEFPWYEYNSVSVCVKTTNTSPSSCALSAIFHKCPCLPRYHISLLSGISVHVSADILSMFCMVKVSMSPQISYQCFVWHSSKPLSLTTHQCLSWSASASCPADCSSYHVHQFLLSDYMAKKHCYLHMQDYKYVYRYVYKYVFW